MKTKYQKEIDILLEFAGAQYGENEELLKKHRISRSTLHRLRKRHHFDVDQITTKLDKKYTSKITEPETEIKPEIN